MRPSDLITVAEAASLMGIGRQAVWKRIKKGQTKAQKVGKGYVLKYSEVLRYLKSA